MKRILNKKLIHFFNSMCIERPLKESFSFLMGIYKIFKHGFRYITNVHNYIFSPITNTDAKLSKAKNLGWFKLHIAFITNFYGLIRFMIMNIRTFMINMSLYLTYPKRFHLILHLILRLVMEQFLIFSIWFHGILGRNILVIKNIGYFGFQYCKKTFKLTKKLKKNF